MYDIVYLRLKNHIIHDTDILYSVFELVQIASQVQFDMKTEFRQAGKQNLFGTHPKWVVSYIAYTKNSTRPAKFSLTIASGRALVSQPVRL